MDKLLVLLGLRSPLGKAIQPGRWNVWAHEPYSIIVGFIFARRESQEPILLPQLGMDFVRFNLRDEFLTRWSKYDIH